MTPAIDLLLYSRLGLLETLEGLTLEQINRVPEGFKNNLAWQLGHVIAVEQKYCYEKGGHPINVAPELLDTYGNGTVPNAPVTQEQLDMLKKLAITTVEQIKSHYEQGLFERYEAFTLTPRKIPVTSISDAVQFIVFHEGMHLGNARDLKRLVAA